jgi:GT2 family glycosyltransferase
VSEKVAPRASTARRRSDERTPACDVAVVVVNYGTPSLTIDCVQSVLRSTGSRPHVVLVDNASSDDSVERFRATFARDDRVTVVARTSNDGYTGGNNAGVAVAKEIGARYTLLLNSDATVDPQCLETLLAEAEGDPAIALLNPRILVGDTTGELWFGGASYSPWRGRPVHVVERDRSLEARDLEFATGCALLVRLDALPADSEVFDASLFAYAEDLDLTRRIRRAGFRVRYVPRALAWHFEGSSHRYAGGRALRFYLSTRNQLRVAARHARWYHWATLAPMLAIDVVGRFALVTLRDGDFAAFRAVIRGALHAVAGGKHPNETLRPDEAW